MYITNDAAIEGSLLKILLMRAVSIASRILPNFLHRRTRLFCQTGDNCEEEFSRIAYVTP